MTDKPEPRKVEPVRPDDRPSKAEPEAGARVAATFEEAVDALAQPVEIRPIPPPEARRLSRWVWRFPA